LGKLAPEQLAELLERHTFSLPDDRVVVYPGVGEDAAVVDMGARWLVAKTDPITFATDEIGWYVVQVNANDIAATGGIPKWFLSTILLPEDRSDVSLVDQIMGQIAEACRALDVVPCGGHTEVTYGLDRPIAIGVMLGEMSPGSLVRSSGMTVGDVVLLTKGAAVEGTAILAREKGPELVNRFPAPFLERCRDFLHDPGISVVQDARVATGCASVHAMHDPTEGGVATGLWELAIASDVGLVVDREAIPVFEETAVLCQVYGLDPLGLIASGALLIAVSPDDAGAVCDALQDQGITARAIARAVPASQGVTIHRGDDVQPLPRYDQDEVARIFA